ncbi:beta strand repeat-containing protein [Halarchaeum sp. P4]|uniref:beta strand repeat-containing protein n=1 Tax=Halarchaeum sp. P4 TaxID=3421639 RepID=UPI003EB9D055
MSRPTAVAAVTALFVLGAVAPSAGAAAVAPGSSTPAVQETATNTTQVALSITASPSNATVGDDVTFTVTNASGSAVSDATVAVANTTLTTDANGTATYSFASAGTYTATASKQSTTNTTYANDSTTVTVESASDATTQVALDLSATPSNATVGENVTFTVTANGTPVPDATVAVANTTLTTDANGTATHAFATAGDYVATASKQSTNDTTYANDSTTVTVESAADTTTQVDLNVSATPADATVGETVTFIVTANGSAVENATVAVANTTLTTDANGTATYAFEAAGDYTVTASKTDTESVSYTSAQTTVSVAEATSIVDLGIAYTPSSDLTPGETVTFTVTNADSEPVPNATVRFSPDKFGTTGPQGQVSYTYLQSGTFDVSATKENTSTTSYVDAQTTVTVASKVIPLKVAVTSGSTPYRPGETVQFQVKNTSSSNPAPNATLYVDDERVPLNDNAVGSYTFSEAGTHTVVAAMETHDGLAYENDSKTLEVEKYTTDLKLTKVPDSSPVRPGHDVAFTVKNSNGNAVGAGYNVTDAATNETYVTDSAGQVTINFTAEGTHTLTVNPADNRTHAFLGDELDVDVERKTIPLTLTKVPDSTLRPATPTEFRVKNGNSGNGLANATVTVANETYVTDADGSVTVTLPSAGNYTLVASNETTLTTEYTNATMNVTATKEDVGLKLSKIPDATPAPNESVAYKVVTANDGKRVPNATVSVASTNAAYTTNASGEVAIALAHERTYTLTASKAANATTTYGSDTLNVTVDDGIPPVYLNASFPGEGAGNVAVDGNGTMNLTLERAPNGLSGLTVRLHAENGTVTFDENATQFVTGGTENMSFTSVNVTDNGSTLTLSMSDVGTDVQSGDSDVTLATIGVNGAANGSGHVSLTGVRVQNESGSQITELVTLGDDVAVTSAPTVAGNAPTNLDGDAAYEDVDGDGTLTFSDVNALFQSMGNDAVHEHPKAFDYNDNGQTDFADVVSLYQQART